MSTFIIKRKTFSEDNMSTGKKVALGTLGTIGAAGLAFAGAKRGVLGNTAMFKANKAWGNLGANLSKSGFNNVGENMMLSGATGMGKARGNVVANRLEKKGVDAAQIQQKRELAENRVRNAQHNKLLAKSST